MTENQSYSLAERRKNCDSIVVSATEKNFQQMFLQEHRWGPIRISLYQLQLIKFLFLYQKKPISSVTHYALIKSIVPDPKSKNKYYLYFENAPTELKKPIPLGKDPTKAPQNPRYLQFYKAVKASSTDELFDYGK